MPIIPHMLAHDIPARSTPDGPVLYFLWDRDVTLDELRAILADRAHPEHLALFSLLLREARPDEVWAFVRPEKVVAEWEDLAPRLGRKRAFWEWLLAGWRRLGYLE